MRLYRLGDRDIAVAEIRTRLAHIGFSVDSTDAQYFDDRVDQAVRAFQQARGLNPDGIVGPLTQQRLEEAHWSLGDRSLSFIPGHLFHGDDVISLQQRLSTLGFDCGKIDGIFGIRTDEALRDFQRSVGEAVDGIAGLETFAALNRLTRTVSGGHAERLRQSVLLDALRTGIANKTIVIDPGHGGSDTGASVDGVSEADVATAVASRLQGRLAALGATVVLTRALQNQVDVEDRERAELCNEVKADLVVSIHCNLAITDTATGIAAFHYGSPHGGWSHDGERAAQRIHRALLAKTSAVDCHIHARTWELLRRTRMPAVRIEVGHLSNDAERAALGDPKYLDQLAAGITDGVVTFFEPAK